MDIGCHLHSDADGRSDGRGVRSQGRKEYVAAGHDRPYQCARVDRLADELGGLDVFVNNAGTGGSELLVDLDYDEWRRIMCADLDGAFVCLRQAARRMVKAGQGGRLIAVTSVHEHQPRVGSGPYDAAKHGLGGLMKTFALELGQYGITANCLAPGEIATPMTGQEDVDPHTVKRPGVPWAGGRAGMPVIASWPVPSELRPPSLLVADGACCNGAKSDPTDLTTGYSLRRRWTKLRLRSDRLVARRRAGLGLRRHRTSGVSCPTTASSRRYLPSSNRGTSPSRRSSPSLPP